MQGHQSSKNSLIVYHQAWPLKKRPFIAHRISSSWFPFESADTSETVENRFSLCRLFRPRSPIQQRKAEEKEAFYRHRATHTQLLGIDSAVSVFLLLCFLPSKQQQICIYFQWIVPWAPSSTWCLPAARTARPEPTSPRRPSSPASSAPGGRAQGRRWGQRIAGIAKVMNDFHKGICKTLMITYLITACVWNLLWLLYFNNLILIMHRTYFTY